MGNIIVVLRYQPDVLLMRKRLNYAFLQVKTISNKHFVNFLHAIMVVIITIRLQHVSAKVLCVAFYLSFITTIIIIHVFYRRSTLHILDIFLANFTVFLFL